MSHPLQNLSIISKSMSFAKRRMNSGEFVMQAVLLFSQEHLEFRLAELRTLKRILDINIDLSTINTDEHVFIVDCGGKTDVELLLSRSMLVKSAYSHILTAKNYDDMEHLVKEQHNFFKKFDRESESFCLRVRPVGRKKGLNCLGAAKRIVESMEIDSAPVNMTSPDNLFIILEEYAGEKSVEVKRLVLGRLIGDGQGSLKNEYSLKTRIYIGNTTMDPELAFLQTNIAGVVNGSLVLDPFVGTGGLLLPAAHFGASVVGTEINYNTAKGQDKFLSTLIADASIHDVWRAGPIFDAIIADPPYGVREKGRKVGKKDRKAHWTEPGAIHEMRYPEKQQYALDATFTDICDMAATRLVVGGHVSFWFPVIREEYSDDCLPIHPALKLIENCEQTLSLKSSRRLLTYEKLREPLREERTTCEKNLFENGTYRQNVFTSMKIPRLEEEAKVNGS